MRTLTFGLCVVALLLPTPVIHAAQSGAAGATITGYVVDGGTQAPIAGARVILLPAPTGRPPGPIGQPPAQVVTGDDGGYTFTGVAAGPYRLQVQKIGFVPPNPTNDVLQVGAGHSVAGPTVRLSRGGAISGRVLDVRGEPMAEVMVSARRKPAPTRAPIRGRVVPAMPAGQPGQTNDIGEFRISGLPAGDYYVSASPRPASPFAESSTNSGTTLVTTFYPGVLTMSSAQVITVAAGQTIGNLEFTMMTAAGYFVSGVVVDEMNRPVAGAMVMLMATDLVGPGPRGSARTQPDGTFKIGGVVPGAYRLNASVPMTFSSGGGTVTGGVSDGVTSVTGGVVTYSSGSGPASMVQVTVGDGDVAGVTVVVRKPAQ
jgi:protocatechuate 3,4-dioxygenase beta subunit